MQPKLRPIAPRLSAGWSALALGVLVAFGQLNLAAAEVQQMPAYKVKASPLGLIGLTMDLDIAGASTDPAKQPIRSMMVKKVLAGSPAEQAGMHAKDTILAIDGQAIPGMSRAALQDLIGAKNVGDPITFDVTGYKSPLRKTITLTVGNGPAAPAK